MMYLCQNLAQKIVNKRHEDKKIVSSSIRLLNSGWASLSEIKKLLFDLTIIFASERLRL